MVMTAEPLPLVAEPVTGCEEEEAMELGKMWRMNTVPLGSPVRV